VDKLAQHYAGNKNPVAFLDESFEVSKSKTFYIIALALVDDGYLDSTRKTLTDFYGGDALHASPMYARKEDETLRQATNLVARNHDGLDIVVYAPIDAEDTKGDAARRRCLEHLLPQIHNEFGTELFVFDKQSTPTQTKLDEYVLSDLRSSKELSRSSVGHHCQPSREPLLGLPDVLAWSYRQHHIGKPHWFAPMKEKTNVQVLSAPVNPL